MTKRILTAVLALLMLLSLTACGGKDTAAMVNQATDPQTTTESGDGQTPPTPELPANPDGPTGTPTDTLVFDENADVTLGTPGKKLDPKTVYDNLEYNARMFFGDYRILGGKDGEKEYAKAMPLVEYQAYDYNKEETTLQVTAIPYRFEAGRHSLSQVLAYDRTHDFMRAYFYTDEGYMTNELCAYTVSGNTLTLNPLAYYNYDVDTDRISYLLSETVFTYEFRFEGRKLTLTDGENTVTLHAALDIDSDDTAIHSEGYLQPDSEPLENIDYLYLRWRWADYGDGWEFSNSFYVEDENFQNDRHGCAVMEDNGLITLTLPDENGGSNTYQFVYFYCYDDGIILTDGETTHYYTATWSDRYNDQLGDNVDVEEMDKLEDMTEEEIEEIIEKKENLLKDLADAFSDAGLDVTVNEETGEITLNAEVLFAYNDYTVSAEGQTLLEQFIGVYNSVVFDEKYEGFLSTIMVEGHTDSTGNYDDNLTLSQNRAESVKTFCVGVSGEHADALEEMMNPIGYASTHPILDASGNEDAAASRRVSFRFLISLG